MRKQVKKKDNPFLWVSPKKTNKMLSSQKDMKEERSALKRLSANDDGEQIMVAGIVSIHLPILHTAHIVIHVLLLTGALNIHGAWAVKGL